MTNSLEDLRARLISKISSGRFALDNIKLPVARNTIPPTNRADERSNRLVGQCSIPGLPPDHAFAAASNAAGEFKNSTAPSRRSSSKEAPHRKEKFVRGDSFPDSDVLVNQDQRQIPETNHKTGIVGHGYIINTELVTVLVARTEVKQHRMKIVSYSCVVPIDSDPGDDTKGKERCDKDNCKIM